MALNTIPTYTDKSLFDKIALDDHQAFRTLFDQYRQVLYGVALKLTKSPLLSEEITQEVFINLWVSRGKLPAVEQPDAYIFRILYNKISEYLRKEANRDKIIKTALQYKPDHVNVTEEAVDVHESEKLIEQALQQLPQQQKTVYRLSRQQGLTTDEIAKQLKISPHTVKSHLARALEFIRIYLNDVAMATAMLITF